MWLGCVEPKYRYDLESVSFTNRSVCISPSSSNMNRISKKQVYSPGSSMLDSSILRPTGLNLELTVDIKSENCLLVPSKKPAPSSIYLFNVTTYGVLMISGVGSAGQEFIMS